MTIQESLDRLVSFLQNVDGTQLEEYFPHIAEALEIDLSTVTEDVDSKIDAIKESVSQVEEDDIEAVVEEIESFFVEEKDEDEDEEEDDDDEESEKEKEEKGSKPKKESFHVTADDVDLSEDNEAVFKNETLTEEFQNKAKTIFESAVVRKVNEKLDEIMEEYDDLFEEKVQEIEESMTEKVDEYLTYVVEEWTKENELAIESGIRSEMTESLMTNLKTVFEDHYVDLPEDKVDMVEELQSKVEELETGLNESLSENAKLSKMLRESNNEDIFDDVAYGLTEMQKDKFHKLTEGITADDDEAYRQKLEIVKENYFSEDPVTTITEDHDDDEDITDPKDELSGAMRNYTQSLSMLGRK